MDDASTLAFRRAAPFAVLAVAPGLAARYVSRARLLSPPCSFPDSCPKCGSYLFDGSSDIRVIRNTKPRNKDDPKNVLRRFCLICRKGSIVKLPRENRALSEPPPMAQPRAMPSLLPAQSSSSHTTNVRPTPPRLQRHQQGGSQRAGLQELLSRNKRKKEPKQNADNTASGLAALLKDL